jgi:hypothetical protein
LLNLTIYFEFYLFEIYPTEIEINFKFDWLLRFIFNFITAAKKTMKFRMSMKIMKPKRIMRPKKTIKKKSIKSK